jgi:hypothetical protein
LRSIILKNINVLLNCLIGWIEAFLIELLNGQIDPYRIVRSIKLCKLLLGTKDVSFLTKAKDLMLVRIMDRRSNDLYGVYQFIILCFVLGRKSSLIYYNTILGSNNCKAHYFLYNKSLSTGGHNSSLIGVSLNRVIIALKYIDYSRFSINDFLIRIAYRGTGIRR